MNSFDGKSSSIKLFQGIALEKPSKSTSSLVLHPNIDLLFPESLQNFIYLLFFFFLVLLIIILERNLH